MSLPETHPDLSQESPLEAVVAEIEQMHLELLSNGLNLVKRQNQLQKDLADQSSAILTKLKEAKNPQSIQQLTNALASISSQQASLQESSTVIFMASLKPLLSLKDSLITGEKTSAATEDISHEPVTDEEQSPKITDFSELSEEEIELLRQDGLIEEEDE